MEHPAGLAQAHRANPSSQHVQLLDCLSLRLNQLAWNQLANAVFEITALEETGMSSAQQIFLDPAARTTYPQWNAVAMEVVGYLRFNAGRDPDNSAIRELVGELSMKSQTFRSMWSQQTVRDKTHGSKLINHPVVGALELDFETFRLPDDSGQALVTYTCLLYTSPSPRDVEEPRMPSSA